MARVANRPTHSVPTTPPTRCSPTPTAPIGLTKPAQGVIATRPATAPDAAPSEVAFPNRRRSTTTQASSADAAAVLVFTKANPARFPAVSAEPELKPNQPNHSIAVPIIVSGRLCGRIGSSG